jgi:hypothetical protein
MPQRGSWMPTRLVSVGKTNSDIGLVAQLPEVQRYTTLSHCWGLGSTLKLMSDNIDELMRRISEGDLPQTYLAMTAKGWTDLMRHELRDEQRGIGHISVLN